MKLASTVIAGLLLADKVSAFAPHSAVQTKARNAGSRFMSMDMEAPPAAPPADNNSNPFGAPAGQPG